MLSGGVPRVLPRLITPHHVVLEMSAVHLMVLDWDKLFGGFIYPVSFSKLSRSSRS